MSKPLIAIVGSSDKSDSPETVRQAARDLGAELAARGCRILVYSSDAQFIDREVVRGYVEAKGKREPKSIMVRLPGYANELLPGEEPGDERFDRHPSGEEWDESFYPSLASTDGLLIMGGGHTTKVAGLIAVGARTPLVALGGFGGASAKVVESLRQDRGALATEEEINLMAQTTWTPASAKRCVDALLEQRERLIQRASAAAANESQRQRERQLSTAAVCASVLFLLVLAAMVELLRTNGLSRQALLALFGLPAIAGVSGALIRVTWNYWRQPEKPTASRPFLMTIGLGLWASGVGGALFTAPQFLALANPSSEQVVRLIPFAVVFGLIAGLTLDRVFPRLIKVDLPLDTGSLTSGRVDAAAGADERTD